MLRGGTIARDQATRRVLPGCDPSSGKCCALGRAGMGCCAPAWPILPRAQTPRSIVQRRQAALAAAARDEATQARFPRLGMVPILDTAEEFARIVSDPQKWLMPWPKTSI